MDLGSIFLRPQILFLDCWVVGAVLYHTHGEPVLIPYLHPTVLAAHNSQVSRAWGCTRHRTLS